MGAWLLGKSHLAAWHGDASSGLRGGARGIDLKKRGMEAQENKEGKYGALREEERGGKETGAWLLSKSHLTAWHSDAGCGFRSSAHGIDLKSRDGGHRGNKKGKDEAFREEEHGGKETGAWLLSKSHLAAWHVDAGCGLRGGARGIDLKARGMEA